MRYRHICKRALNFTHIEDTDRGVGGLKTTETLRYRHICKRALKIEVWESFKGFTDKQNKSQRCGRTWKS